MDMYEIEELRRILAEAERVVFFGGAGVSTDSGIPDFRGTGGIYTREDEEDDPGTILRASYLMGNPEDFYRYYRANMLYPDAGPNPAHFSLAELERTGKLTAVVTQNIDGLHQAAGSTNVFELHGSVHRNYCVRCGKQHSLAHILESPGAPRCTACGGLVRPDVVMFGESLDSNAYFGAQAAIYEADVLIVGGTSLTVYPAASLVEEFAGDHLIIINKTPTPMDGNAEFVLREPISQVLYQLIE